MQDQKFGDKIENQDLESKMNQALIYSFGGIAPRSDRKDGAITKEIDVDGKKYRINAIISTNLACKGHVKLKAQMINGIKHQEVSEPDTYNTEVRIITYLQLS